MLATKPESTQSAGQLMYLSGGLAIGAGLLAWLATGATVYWLAVELALGVLWVTAARVIRGGRWPVRVAATALCVISVPVTVVMLVLLSLFAASWPGVIVMFCDVIRLPLPVVILALLWTRGSRRYFRYVRAGGQTEPRPRWTLHRASAPRAEGPVTDADVRLLRDYLQQGGEAAYPESALAEAALAEAATRRFGKKATRRQVADCVTEILAKPGSPRQDVWPRSAEKLLLAAMSGRPARGIDPRVRRATSGLLLLALAPAGHDNAAATEEFLTAARRRAGQQLS